MRFFRRTSAGSRPASSAKRSIARSIACVASGRPAPRYAVIGVVFVTTETASTSIAGIAYGPDAHIFVSIGRIAPISG